jgi:flap endonuclease-1
MGIKNLNKYLRTNCTSYSIEKTHLKNYKNKTIVIDTSIYMYRFLADNALVENFYLMISLFKTYDITPLFIFDGKPPAEKYETLKQRRNERYNAKQRYTEILDIIKNKNISTNSFKYKDLQSELEILKRKIIKVKENDIDKVKNLMDLYGVSHFTGIGEADGLCAYLVLSGQADACMSDDTDMFIYNCPYILRNLSLINHTVIHHNTNKIFNEINIPYKDFITITILNGTDYNDGSNYSFEELSEYYKEYSEYIKNTNSVELFEDWLKKKDVGIEVDYNKLRSLYMIDYSVYNDITKNIIIKNKNPCIKQLYDELKKEGFVFYNNVDNKLPWKSSIPV